LATGVAYVGHVSLNSGAATPGWCLTWRQYGRGRDLGRADGRTGGTSHNRAQRISYNHTLARWCKSSVKTTIIVNGKVQNLTPTN